MRGLGLALMLRVLMRINSGFIFAARLKAFAELGFYFRQLRVGEIGFA